MKKNETPPKEDDFSIKYQEIEGVARKNFFSEGRQFKFMHWAADIGTTITTLRRWQAGQYPNARDMRALCQTLGISPRWLLLDEGPMLDGEKMEAESDAVQQIVSLRREVCELKDSLLEAYKENIALRKQLDDVRQQQTQSALHDADTFIPAAAVRS